MIGAVLLRIVLFAALGGFIGAAYFAALAWNVRLYAGHGPGRKALPLHLSRVAAAAAVFTLCARQGAAQILASFAGFLLIRTISVRHYGVAPERNP
jgi:F1F0 ATPase subunit 2